MPRIRTIGLLTALAFLAACARAPAVDTGAETHAIAVSNQPRFQAPQGWAWGSLVNGDGAHLRYGWTEAAGPRRGVIVMAPSFQAPAEEYFETIRDFSRAGYAVWIMDRRGQGGSDRWAGVAEGAYLDGGEREARDLRQFTSLALAHDPGVPAYLVGESFGGVVGARLLHDSPGLFKAAAFSSPGIDFQTNGVPRGLLRAITFSACAVGLCTHYAPTQGDWAFDPKGGTLADPVRDDPDRALAEEGWLLSRPRLREGGATFGFVRTLFEEADRDRAAGFAEAIQTPVLFGYTPKDRIARPDAIQAACKRMPRCTLVELASTGHAFFTDADATRSVWMKQVVDFLDR